MVRLSVFLFFLIASGLLHCQQLLKKDLLADLRFLNEAVQYGHPENYRKVQNVIDLNPVIQEVEQAYPDSVSWRMYESAVRKAVFSIGCVHTTVTNSPIRTKESVKNGFFPLSVFTKDGQLFLLENPSDTNSVLRKGDEILAVNGISSFSMIWNMQTYRSVDGISASFARAKDLLNRNFSALYFIYFGASENYTVDFMHDGHRMTETFAGTDKSVLKSREVKIEPFTNTTILFKAEKASFGMVNDTIAYLRIESFKKHCKPFYRKVFRYLEENKTSLMIIDLRDNLGGSRTNAEVLLSYLMPQVVSYEIIRPKKNLGKYLKGKNKLTFLSSYFYFDVKNYAKRNYSRGRRKDGAAFIYSIQPKRRFVYKHEISILVNNYSASSSTLVASYLSHYAYASIIGDQPIGGADWNNGGSYPTLVLPNSGIEIKTATYRIQYDFSDAYEYNHGLFTTVPEGDVNHIGLEDLIELVVKSRH